MTRSPWDDDDDLLAELAEALRSDAAVHDEWRRAAEGALSWRNVDGELAALTYDSVQDAGLMARARSSTLRRTVVFEHDTVRIELELTADGIVGQLTPMGARSLLLEGADGLTSEAEADDLGSFLFELPLTGPVRLRCRVGDVDVATDWIGL